MGKGIRNSGPSQKRVRTKIGRFIHIPDDASDRSLFNLPVHANGASAFNLALYLITRGLQGLDARIVHASFDEIVIET